MKSVLVDKVPPSGIDPPPLLFDALPGYRLRVHRHRYKPLGDGVWRCECGEGWMNAGAGERARLAFAQRPRIR